jgi:hypothetical protein
MSPDTETTRSSSSGALEVVKPGKKRNSEFGKIVLESIS